MGLREILTRPMGFGSAEFYWNEPTLYRIRLRGDLWMRVAVVFGAWAAATGILWALFATNVHRPGPGLGIGLGLIPAGIAALLVFFLRDHVSGRVSVESDGIRRYRTYGGLTPEAWSEWQEWPFRAIGRCTIVPAEAIGKSFSVLLLAVGDDREIVGLPRYVDVPKLVKYLSRQGVTVTQGKGIPPQFTPRLNMGVAAGVPAVGVVTLLGGFAWFLSARGQGGANRPNRPQFDNGPLIVDNRNDGPHPWQPPPVVPEGNTGNVPDNPVPQGPRTRKTEMAGGAGGFDFSRVQPEGKPVIGFRNAFGSWAGVTYVNRFEPLYGFEVEVPGTQSVTAKEGYAVGALLVDAPELITAYAAVFMRIKPDGGLDPNDSYTSEWIGPPPSGEPKKVTGNGATVLGVHGRAGAVLNAVGLILADE